MNRPYIIFFIAIVIYAFTTSVAYSQDTELQEADSAIATAKTNDSSTELPTGSISPEVYTEFKNFEELHIGYYGTTQNCLPFNIYAYKYKRTWFLIANQDLNITFIVVNPPRMEGVEVADGSEYLLYGIGKANTHLYTKLKKRRKVVKDLKVYGYYKFRRVGKKAIKGLLYLEFPEVDLGPPWPFKWVSSEAAKTAKDIEGVLPEIKVPEVKVPEVKVPEIEIPPVTIPGQ